VPWSTWIRNGREVEPSLYAADFARLGEQLTRLLDVGVRIFHFDIGDGHFVPPVTIGPVVLRSIAPLVHERGGVLDCHLMVTDPAHHFEEIARSGGDSVTFHVEAAADPAGVAAKARDLGLAVGVSFNPGTSPDAAAAAAETAEAELVLCMSIWPGYSGQPFMPEALPRIERLAGLVSCPVQVDGGVGEETIEQVGAAGARLFVAGSAIFADPEPAAAYARLAAAVSA
jgi:ribulose-phosphate 3-epimerase